MPTRNTFKKKLNFILFENKPFIAVLAHDWYIFFLKIIFQTMLINPNVTWGGF